MELLKPQEDSPITWTNDMLKNWVDKYSKGKVDCSKFCPFESGK